MNYTTKSIKLLKEFHFFCAEQEEDIESRVPNTYGQDCRNIKLIFKRDCSL